MGKDIMAMTNPKEQVNSLSIEISMRWLLLRISGRQQAKNE